MQVTKLNKETPSLLVTVQGTQTKGRYAIAIGDGAGEGTQHDSTIILNASGIPLNSTGTGNCYIRPIRNDTGTTTGDALLYNAVTHEVYTMTGATTIKTFVIDHPSDSEKYLIHACLEGPESGVYYRGTGTIAARATTVVISLPAYVDTIATEFTVQLTPIGVAATLHTSAVEEGAFTVTSDTPCSFYWHVHGLRETIDVEPTKTTKAVTRMGPYAWVRSI